MNGTTRLNIMLGDVRDRLAELPAESVHCVVTSPPYLGLRDYGVDGQIGLERGWREHVAVMLGVFAQVRRVLRKDGTVWLNYGDVYAQAGRSVERRELEEDAERAARKGYYTEAFSGYGGWNRAAGTVGDGLKEKDLVGLPWRLAFALQEAGWWLRSDCIWSKKNPMPSSVADRPTTSHEYIFLLSKSARYYYDREAVRVPLATVEKRTTRIAYNGKSEATSTFIPPNPNGRNCWTVQSAPEKVDKSALWQFFLAAFEDSQADLGTVWDLACQAYKGAHFATFPERLPETCIRASTSEHGACAACGAPWRRLVEPTPEYAALLGKSFHDHSSDMKTGHRNGRTLSRGQSLYETTGWEPTCACGTTERVPCVVLDPFTGSGTTGLVALREGRSFWGTELNPDYHRQAVERCEAALHGLPLREFRSGQRSLFADLESA